MREKVNRKQNAAFKALWSKSSSRVTNVNCHMGSVPIGGQPSVHNDHDGQKSPISDKIEPITKASDNLCLLNCMYQALRTWALRHAFSAHNLMEVAKAFVELAAGRLDFESGELIDREQDGYVGKDMLRYLQFLKEHIYIKDFVFLRLQLLARPKIFIELFTKSHHQVEEKVFVFFGYSLPSDEKKLMAKRFEKLRKSLCSEKYSHLSGEKQRLAVELDMIKFYNNLDEMATLRNRFQIPMNKHGISIGIDKDKSMWLYDNGNKVRKSVTSIEHVAPYLLSYWDVYVFKMTLW